MVRIKNLFTVIAALLFLLGCVSAQSKDRGRIASRTSPVGLSGDQCLLNGTYRIDVADSDGLFSVVKNAKSSVPFADQQRFFMDLSTRLTPPDMLAIECHGRRVSVGSTRASKMTYIADGKNRRENLAGGGYVNSKITLGTDSLTFVSVGDVEDNVNVSFEAVDGGRRMSVTRRIYAKQLPEPIIIQTFYDRISTAVEWKLYDGSLVAEQRTAATPRPVSRPENNMQSKGAQGLRADFASWLDATNRRDISKQMQFYMPELKAYYLSRNTPLRAVRLEKERVFGAARSVDIQVGDPEIVLQDGGQTAVMRFVKEYSVAGRSTTREGSVIQELRWQLTSDGWRIFSERDVRVLR